MAVAAGDQHVYQAVAFFQAQRNDSRLVDVAVLLQCRALHLAVGGEEEQEVLALFKLGNWSPRADALVGTEFQEVLNGASLCGARSFRNLPDLHLEDATSVREAQEIVVAGTHVELFHKVSIIIIASRGLAAA